MSAYVEVSGNITFPETCGGRLSRASHAVFEKPYDVIWEWVSNPMNSPALYRHWVAEIVHVADDRLEIVTPLPPTRLHLTLHTDRELGIIDLDVSPGAPSRSRVLPLASERTVQIRVPVKGSLPEDGFRSITENTDRDSGNAKRITG